MRQGVECGSDGEDTSGSGGKTSALDEEADLSDVVPANSAAGRFLCPTTSGRPHCGSGSTVAAGVDHPRGL